MRWKLKETRKRNEEACLVFFFWYFCFFFVVIFSSSQNFFSRNLRRWRTTSFPAHFESLPRRSLLVLLRSSWFENWLGLRGQFSSRTSSRSYQAVEPKVEKKYAIFFEEKFWINSRQRLDSRKRIFFCSLVGFLIFDVFISSFLSVKFKRSMFFICDLLLNNLFTAKILCFLFLDP